MTEYQTSQGPRMLRAVGTLLLLGILLYGLGGSLYIAAFALFGERWPWIAWANNFLPWWALGGGIAAILALVSRWRWVLLALQLPLIGAFILLYGDLLLPPDATATPAGPRFTAATFNIRGWQTDPAQVAATIRALDADIIGLQEVNRRHGRWIERELGDIYPYQVFDQRWSREGVALLSRYPINAEQTFRLMRDSVPGLRAEIAVDGKQLAVYVVHPQSPTNAMLPVGYDTSFRDREITMLLDDHFSDEQGPLLILGDFNMVDVSEPYRAMAAELDDAFRAAGQGLGFTFPAKPASGILPRMLRIDYIWYNAGLAALDAHAGSDSGKSDHYPVIADLAFDESTAAE